MSDFWRLSCQFRAVSVWWQLWPDLNHRDHHHSAVMSTAPQGLKNQTPLMPFINAEHKQASRGTCTQTSSFVFVFLSCSLLPTLYLSGFHPFLCFLFFFSNSVWSIPCNTKTLEGVEFQQWGVHCAVTRWDHSAGSHSKVCTVPDKKKKQPLKL